MAQKFITNNAGTLTEVEATLVSAGAGSAGKIPALGGTGKLDVSVMPVGFGDDTGAVVASEALSSGSYVNIWDSAGSARVRKADGTSVGKEAHGFVLAAVGIGELATVYFEGTNIAVTNLAAGPVYLSTTPGIASNTAPSGSGNVVQRLGFSLGPSGINFQYNNPIVLA